MDMSDYHLHRSSSANTEQHRRLSEGHSNNYLQEQESNTMTIPSDRLQSDTQHINSSPFVDQRATNDNSNNNVNYERAAADALSYNPKKKHNDNKRIESTSLPNRMSREFHNSATDAALAAAANASSNNNNKVPTASADELADRLISYAQITTSNNNNISPISRQQQTSPQTQQVVGNNNVNIMNNRGNSSAMVKPPPPPPPPPRRSQNIGSPSMDTTNNNMSASNTNCKNIPPTPILDRNFSGSTGDLPQPKLTLLSPRERELEHEKEQYKQEAEKLEHKTKAMAEQLRIANLKLAKSEQSPKGVPKGGILKNSITSNTRMNASYQENMNRSTSLATNNKNEAQFKQFASMSLNDLDNNSKTNKQKSMNMMSSVQELNNSSMSVSSREGFSPRPVKITQFDDNDNYDKNTKAATSTTTTASFVNSIRKLPYEKKHTNNLNPMHTPVEDIQTPNSIMSPSSMKSPASSVVRTVDTLPDNVDKKGRCLKHPNIKLFKKKLLGGSYDMIRESCPSCIEEAPYQNLWKSQAKSRGFKKWQEEKGGPSTMDREVIKSRERGRSIDESLSATASRSVSSRSRERISRSKSRERKKSQERRSKSRERRSDDEMPYVPALQGDREYTGDLTKKRHPPPPPPSQSSSHRRDIGDLQRRGRRRSKDDRGRVLEIPATSSVTSELTPVSLPHNTQSLFDKGINTLASLQSRARSSSRKRQGKSSASDNGPSRPSRSVSPKNLYYLNVKSGVATLGSNKTKKSSTSKIENMSASELSKKHLAFDKKTGRCKYHPSIILAKKSPFAKGWDIIKDSCPFCAEKSSAEDQFGEISKKKMNKLLGGQGNSLKSYTASESNEGISSSEKRRHKPPCQKQAIVEGAFTAPESNRVSRMPYTAPSGECSGWYTGEVNSHGKPHGNGRMRCKTGRSIEGEWYQGESLDYLEKKGRIKSGFGTNVAPWKEDPRFVASPSVESGQQQPQSNQQGVMSSQQYQGQQGNQPQQQQQAYYAAPQMPARMVHNNPQGYKQQYFQAPVQQQQQPGNQNQMNHRQQGY